MLAVGTEAEHVSTTAQFFGCDVMAYSWDRLSPASLAQYADTPVDTVVLNLIGAQPHHYSLSSWSLLEDCARALLPDGTLVLAVDNTHSLTNLHQDAALTKRSLRAKPGTIRQWQECIAMLGLALDSTRSLWPSSQEWRMITPLHRPPSNAFRSSRPSVQGILANGFLSLFRRMGGARWGAPGFVFVARKQAAYKPNSLLDHILIAEDADATHPTISTQPNSISLTVVAGSKFIKLPLNKTARSSVLRQCSVIERLASKPIAPYLPHPSATKTANAVTYAVFPAVPLSNDTTNLTISTEALQHILSLLATDARPTRLTDTDAWARITDPNSREYLRQIGGEAALSHLERRAADLYAPSGNVHGDLHLANILVGNQPVLVDWDRFEECSPCVLDAIGLSLSIIMSQNPDGPKHALLAKGIQRIANGCIDIPMRSQVHSSLGDLSWAEASTLYVLHRASWTNHFHPHLYSEARIKFQGQFSACLDATETQFRNGV